MTTKGQGDGARVELKACPFCGLHLEPSESLSNRRAKAFVHPVPAEGIYDECLLASIVLFDTDKDRANLWNTRVPSHGLTPEEVVGAAEAVKNADVEFWLARIRKGNELLGAAEQENEALRLAMLGGEDAPGYAASLPLAEVIRSHHEYTVSQRDRAERAELALSQFKSGLEALREPVARIIREKVFASVQPNADGETVDGERDAADSILALIKSLAQTEGS